ncbi:MAG: glycosyltransferase, partial [Flavobacteriales bacterium CG_4_8_14_3_um_filter_35_10]
MKISIVTTLYKSKIFLDQFISEIQIALKQIQCIDYELVFVNDGSPDDSLQFLIERKKEIPQIKLIDLSRNFGHHCAIQIGLNYASGDYVFLIDNDLETSPN